MSYSRADLEQIISLISKQDIETLKAEDYDQFQYQGFDPMKLIASLVTKKKEKSMSDADFIKDVIKMVALGMIKGSISAKNIVKMSEEGRKEVTELNTRFGITFGGGKGQAATVITYPRVMASFPDIAVRLTKVIGGKEFTGGPLLSSRLPQYMQVQVFPSIIPRNLATRSLKFLLIACLAYSIDQSVQISEMKDPDLQAVAATQGNFTNVGHNSPVPSAATRLTVFSGLPLSKDFDIIESVVLTYKEKVDKTLEVITKQDFIADVTSLSK